MQHKVPAARVDGQWLPRLQFIDKVVGIPVMIQRQVRCANCTEDRQDSSVQFFGKVADAHCCITTGAGDGRDNTVEVPQLQFDCREHPCCGAEAKAAAAVYRLPSTLLLLSSGKFGKM